MYIGKIILSTKKKADGVVEILNTKGSEFSLFDENFLKEIAEMKAEEEKKSKKAKKSGDIDGQMDIFSFMGM